MTTILTTCLYDIKRDLNGDGRSIEEYLEWFSNTLKLKVDMNIFIEQKFYNFVLEERNKIDNKTNIEIIDFVNLPLYKFNNNIKNMFLQNEYIKNMKDRNRIECKLSEYLIIIYSKFFFLKQTLENNNDYDYYFWIDAGYSRFFYNNIYNKKKWPKENFLNKNKITIHTVLDAHDNILNHSSEQDYWNNNSYISAGLFCGGFEPIEKLCNFMFDFFNESLKNNKLNNEQIAFQFFIRENFHLFDLYNVLRNRQNLYLFQALLNGDD